MGFGRSSREYAASRRRFLTESRRPAAIRESPRAAWYVVATVCIGAFMGQFDASIVTLALPRLDASFHASVSAVEWVSLVYLLVLVASVAVRSLSTRMRHLVGVFSERPPVGLVC